MAESTKIPTARIRAKREIKLRVLPVKYKPIKDTKNESGTAKPAIKASLQPIAKNKIRTTKETVANPDMERFFKSSLRYSAISTEISTSVPSKIPLFCKLSNFSFTPFTISLISPPLFLKTDKDTAC